MKTKKRQTCCGLKDVDEVITVMGQPERLYVMKTQNNQQSTLNHNTQLEEIKEIISHR
jgi:hypothetical protein